MYKSPGVSLMVGLFIILLTLITFIRGDTKIVNIMEGESTKLNFSYPCDSARVTLRCGMRAPFYDTANLESLSLPDNQELHVFQIETESNNCLLQLKINPVLRSDECGCILTAYDGDGNILEDPRVGLGVDYPPGKASCEWGEKNVGDDLGSMRCKAPAGSLPGQIVCYQNGIRLPPVTLSTEIGDILQQTIWVRYPQTAFCCASLKDQPIIDRCACDDFVWDPLHSGNITDPCSAPQHDSRPPQSPKEDNISSPTIATLSPVKETITEIPVRNNVYIPLHPGVIVAFVLLVLIIVALIVFLTVSCRKIGKIREQRNKKQQQGSDYTSVPTVEMQP